MVLLTMIARVADGLLLAATMQEDEQVIDILFSSAKRHSMTPIKTPLFNKSSIFLLLTYSI